MKYVLFVCTHKAGRSQMAQAFFERYAPADLRAESAGAGQPLEKVREIRDRNELLPIGGLRGDLARRLVASQ
jgi:protein-tyrosine-phosphatase